MSLCFSLSLSRTLSLSLSFFSCEVLSALLAGDERSVARLTAKGRWALRGLLRGGPGAFKNP